MTIFNMILLAALAALLLAIVIAMAIFAAGFWLIAATTASIRRGRQARQDRGQPLLKAPDRKMEPIILDLADLEKETT